MKPVPTPALEPTAPDVADAAPRDQPQPMTLASIPDPAARQALAPQPTPALPPGLLPWPVATTSPEPPETTASVTEPMAQAAPAHEAFGPVPLPRKRPDARAMALLAIPLPRPRPEAAPVVEETAELPAEEELLFRRQGHSE